MFDLDSGQVLWGAPAAAAADRVAHEDHDRAVVVERTRPRDRVRITHEALAYKGSGVGLLPKEKLVPVEGLLPACCCRPATTPRSRSRPRRRARPRAS